MRYQPNMPEAVFGDEADEELDGKQSHHEGHHIAHYQGRHVVDDDFRSAVKKQFQHLVGSGGKHGGNSQKERELAACLRVSPCAMPPTMVAMERDTPGIMAMH